MVNIARRFPVTVTLLAVTVAFFLLEHALGGGQDRFAHLRLGALAPVRVAHDGEYFRLFMPMFLHGGLVHLLFNGFALLQLGALVEVFWGGRRLLLYYVVCGLGSSLTSAAFNTTVDYSLGASGAILGLAGLILGTSWYGRAPVRDQLLDLVGRQLLYGVLLTFGLGLGLWLIVPLVDNWGHLGGLATGFLIAAAVPDPTHEDLRRSWAASAAALAALAASVGWMAAEGGRAVEPEGEVQLARSIAARISEGSHPPRTVGSRTAHMVVTFIDAGAPDEGLETLSRAVGRMQEPAELQWTLAYLASFEEELTEPSEAIALHRAILVASEGWVVVEPDSADAHNTLAWHLVQGPDETRDAERAVGIARQSLDRIPPSDDYRRSMVLDTLAEALFQTGDLEAAEQAQSEAVGLANEAPVSLFQQVGLAPRLPLQEMNERLDRIRSASSG